MSGPAATRGITPGTNGDPWILATTSRYNGQALFVIHSLRTAALELIARERFRFRIGISWRFLHPLDNGLPGDEDRAPMLAIDDAIETDLQRDDALRTVYRSCGGGIREVVLYAQDADMAQARVEALLTRFPTYFPGDERQWWFVEADVDWAWFRAMLAHLQPSAK